MNTLLIFFALPVAIIIFSIALQKVLQNPLLVAGIIFSIFLVTTFVLDNLNILVATLAYTMLSFVTAYLYCLFRRNMDDDDDCGCSNNDNDDNNCSMNMCNRTYNRSYRRI